MATHFVGQIVLFGCNFAPTGWAFCDGQLIQISQNTALFSLLGTMYGGNGTTNFALPDLRGCVPMGFGQGPGLTDRVQGEFGGTEAVTLTVGQMPAHSHEITNALTAAARCRNAPGNRLTPVGNVPASEAIGGTLPYATGAPDAVMNAGAIALGGSVSALDTGGGLGHENRQPYMAMNYCIALNGVFPSRS